MKMKKKHILVCALSLMLIMMLTACGDKKQESKDPGKTTGDNSDVAATESGDEADSDFLMDGITIQMDGKELSMPFKWSEIGSDIPADKFSTEPPTEITYGDESIGYYWDSRNGNGSNIIVDVYNPNPETPIGAEDSLVCYIYLHTIMDDDNKVDLILPEGITFGATYEDVIKAYGAPTRETKPDGNVVSTIYESEDEAYTMELHYKNNVVTGCRLQYEY